MYSRPTWVTYCRSISEKESKEWLEKERGRRGGKEGREAILSNARHRRLYSSNFMFFMPVSTCYLAS